MKVEKSRRFATDFCKTNSAILLILPGVSKTTGVEAAAATVPVRPGVV
jgi:hypothetical protein